VVRTFISLPAGIAGMPAARFGLYTVAGCIPWTAGLALAGYGVGRNWQAIVSGFRGPSYAIAGILAVLLIVAVAAYARRRAAGSRLLPAHAAGTPQGTGTPATQAGRQRSAR
jgi:membrane protein DedA with SNARE-associated domain